MAVSSCVAKKEKHRWFSAYVVHVCLFAKGVFCHLPSEKCRAIWEEKADLIFSLHSLNPHALEEREQRKQQDSRSFCKIHIPSARFAFLFPTVAFVFSHPLLVWNIVGGFCMSASFMFNNRSFVCYLLLLVWMCCVFYVEESYIGGYACMQKMVCCCVLGFWFPCFHPLPTSIASYNRKIVVGFLFLVLFCGTFTRNYWTNHLGEHSEPLIWTERTT